MIFFADTIMYKTEKREENKAGHIITTYIKLEDEYYVDIQPVDEKAIKYTWGDNIKSTLSMYSDENLKVEDVVIVDDSAYKVEKKIKWDSYCLYALMESDEVVNGL